MALLLVCVSYSCPPRTFIPALCKIFMDSSAPDNVVEVTARALTYYLDVSVDCIRKIASVDGALKAVVRRLDYMDMSSKTSKDITEQCVKVCSIPYLSVSLFASSLSFSSHFVSLF